MKEEEQVEDSDSDETLNEKQKENELGKVIDNLNMYDIMDDDVSSILITHKDSHHPSSNYNNKKRVQAPQYTSKAEEPPYQKYKKIAGEE